MAAVDIGPERASERLAGWRWRVALLVVGVALIAASAVLLPSTNPLSDATAAVTRQALAVGTDVGTI